MIINRFELVITTPPDRDRPVVEIYFQDRQWAEVSQETEEIRVIFYTYKEKDMWEFTYNESMEALYAAKELLLKPLQD